MKRNQLPNMETTSKQKTHTIPLPTVILYYLESKREKKNASSGCFKIKGKINT